MQQVVDEKISVECDMATREGRMVTELYTEEGMSVPVMSEMSYVVSQSMGKLEQGEKDRINDTNIERTSEPVKRGRMDDNQVRVVGWLDITEGSIQGGNPLSRPLEEGEYVMIAAKVKQVKGMDTMMTRCGMDDGQGDVRNLTDGK